MGSEALKPCPFCGSANIDPEGWSRNDGVSGPACDDCGASAESVAQWNKRAFEPCGVIAEIAAERQRQIEAEGWTPGHDDEHTDGAMAQAAAAYAYATTLPERIRRYVTGIYSIENDGILSTIWPKGWKWKPKDPRRDLIRAAALVAAELERLDRQAASATQEGA